MNDTLVESIIDVSKFTPRGVEFLKLAVEEAKRMKHTYVGLVHLNVAMEKMKDRCPARTFEPYEI